MDAPGGGGGVTKLQLRTTVSADSRPGRRRLLRTGPTVGTGVSSIVPLSEMFCRLESITRTPSQPISPRHILEVIPHQCAPRADEVAGAFPWSSRVRARWLSVASIALL